MKFNKKMLTLVVSLGLGMGAAGTYAGGDKANVAEGAKAASAQASAIERLALADELASYGDSENDAMALIVAAKIKQGVGSKDASFEKSSSGGKGAGKDDDNADSAAAMLARAKDMADGRKDLLAMITDVEESSSRGDITGPNRHRDMVRAGATDVYDIVFEGGEPAEVLVSGDGDTDLDLFIYDEHGNRICSDADETDTMMCSWQPRWTGKFQLRIQNLGNVANIYTLYTN